MRRPRTEPETAESLAGRYSAEELAAARDGTAPLPPLRSVPVPPDAPTLAAAAALAGERRRERAEAPPTPARRLVEAVGAVTGLSQVGVAEAIGVEPSTLWRWMAGDVALPGPARKLLRLLAREPHQAPAVGAD